MDTAFSADLILSNALAASDYILFVVDLKNIGERNIKNMLRLSVDINNNFNSELKILGTVINKINPDVDFVSLRKEYKKIFQDSLFDASLSENSILRIASRDNKFLREIEGLDAIMAVNEINKITDEFLRRLKNFKSS